MDGIQCDTSPWSLRKLDHDLIRWRGFSGRTMTSITILCDVPECRFRTKASLKFSYDGFDIHLKSRIVCLLFTLRSCSIALMMNLKLSIMSSASAQVSIITFPRPTRSIRENLTSSRAPVGFGVPGWWQSINVTSTSRLATRKSTLRFRYDKISFTVNITRAMLCHDDKQSILKYCVHELLLNKLWWDQFWEA